MIVRSGREIKLPIIKESGWVSKYMTSARKVFSKTPANPTRMDKAITYGVPTAVAGTAAAGTIWGVKQLYNEKPQVPYKHNYTTFLRNNIISGNINPAELTQPDVKTVRRLGMR